MKETRFKDTEIGRIPEDWEAKPLKSIAQVHGRIGFRGYTVADLVETGNGAYVIGGKHISKNRLDLSDPDFISWFKYYESPEIMVNKGDLVIAQRGTLGRVAYIDREIGPATINPSLVLLNNIKCSGAFVHQILASKVYTDKILSISAQTSIPMISQNQIENFIIAFPNIAEQTRIASALTSIDNLLSSLDKLIAKKKDIKKGTMQQLLTGKKRLKGFTEPWVERTLGSFDIQNGSMLKSTDYKQGRIPVIAGGKTPAGYHSVSNRDSNTITISGSGANAGYVAFYSQPIFASDCSTINVQDGIAIEYLYFTLLIRQNEIYMCQTGGAQPHIHAKDIKDIVILLPSSIEEQTAIASVLTAMDNEIAALEAKRAKYESIKQGMMQQLLTGKIRLVETAAKTNTITANVHFRRSVLAAEIADRLCDEPTFGHVKMEKMLFLTERLCDINIGSHYHRDAAGPYDNNALRSIDSQLRKQKWFEIQQTEKGYKYVAMPNRGKHKTYFDKYYSNVLPMFDKIINTFKTQRTEQCEIVATLYSAWEDLIHKNQPFTDADIVNEVLNNWHESKKRISRDRWQESIQWMRNNGFAPNSTSI